MTAQPSPEQEQVANLGPSSASAPGRCAATVAAGYRHLTRASLEDYLSACEQLRDVLQGLLQGMSSTSLINQNTASCIDVRHESATMRMYTACC